MRRQFELVSKYTNTNLLPTRATDGSAGYDFKVAQDIIVPPYYRMVDAMRRLTDVNKILDLDAVKLYTKAHKVQPTLVPTGVKCQLYPREFLQISLRSSCALNHWFILANGVGKLF